MVKSWANSQITPVRTGLSKHCKLNGDVKIVVNEYLIHLKAFYVVQGVSESENDWLYHLK